MNIMILKIMILNTRLLLVCNNESFISLITSYPFVQLTFIFFFTMMFGIIETSSMKNFGKLNGHSEEFLWYTSFMWKIINFIFFPLWGYFFDKMDSKDSIE